MNAEMLRRLAETHSRVCETIATLLETTPPSEVDKRNDLAQQWTAAYDDLLCVRSWTHQDSLQPLPLVPDFVLAARSQPADTAKQRVARSWRVYDLIVPIALLGHVMMVMLPIARQRVITLSVTETPPPVITVPFLVALCVFRRIRSGPLAAAQVWAAACFALPTISLVFILLRAPRLLEAELEHHLAGASVDSVRGAIGLPVLMLCGVMHVNQPFSSTVRLGLAIYLLGVFTLVYLIASIRSGDERWMTVMRGELGPFVGGMLLAVATCQAAWLYEKRNGAV